MQHAVLISDAASTCGVEEFARQSARHMGSRAQMVRLGETLDGAGDVVINLPVVAWKKRLAAPVVAALKARLAGKSVSIVLHEWADLALARRISYLPLLPLATRLFFSSPEVMAQFESTPVARIATRTRAVIPIPPNFTVPDWTTSTPLSQALAASRAAGAFVLGQFGSIYPRKDPQLLLEAGAELLRRGVDVRIAFIGSFIRDSHATEAEFHAAVERLGLSGRVDVSGYVATAAEIYGLFEQVDAFLYPLSEGLTSRRGSVQVAALSGRPVIVTAPVRRDSLSHHRLFRTLIAAGAIQFVQHGADAGALADAVMATRGLPVRPVAAGREIATVWDDVAAALEA